MLYSDIYKYSRTKPKFRGSKIKKAAMKRGLYSFDQVTNLIVNENYIPVATAAELDALRNTGARTMGTGSPWEGTYTTGLDKNYIQVSNIDLDSIDFSILDSSIENNLIYDGNNLNIINFFGTGKANYSLFRIRPSQTVRNLNIHGEITGTNALSLLCFDLNGTIENCNIYGNITTNNVGGLIAGIINGGKILNSNAFGKVLTSSTTRTGSGLIFGNTTGGLSGELIENCIADGEVEGFNSDSIGVFGGYMTKGTIRNCIAKGTLKNPGTTGDKYHGGFIGAKDGASTIIEKCGANVDVTGFRYGGGFCGYSRGTSSTIKDCYATGSVTLTQQYAAGFLSRNLTSGVIENCYSSGAVSGTANTGGFCAQNNATITNCYYDINTSGQSDTGKGLPRTTLQMQQGTADSFILPGGGVDGTSDPANAMYTAWDGTIWKFTPLNAYPTLK